jgi:DNA-binding transcriptional LysR family regulator
MNIHHLELFYYVAKHGGVSAAARHIPYGIQQPAISAQVIQLEDNLGAMLFTRRPFRLTKTGEELYKFIEPFFGGLEAMGRRLRGGAEVNIRIGALETVLRTYLPRLIRAMRERFPSMTFNLVPADLQEIEARLLAQEIDIGIAPLLGVRKAGIKQQEMVRVPMALVVPESSKLDQPEALWKQDRITEPLIAGPSDNAVCRLFQSELQKRDIEWFPSIELNSQEMITRYVAEGFGIGLVLSEPGLPAMDDDVRVLPLKGFATVPYGLLWLGVLSPLQRAFVQEAENVARTFPQPEPGVNEEKAKPRKARKPAARS